LRRFGSECSAPTALTIAPHAYPALAGWANLWRASGVWSCSSSLALERVRRSLFKDAVVGFEIAPHFDLRVRSNDGDLGDVEFGRSKSAKIFGDGFGSLGGQADDAVAQGVEAGAIEAHSETQRRRVGHPARGSCVPQDQLKAC
jgi:hypothetical protein